MFCMNCGMELPDKAKFCLSCGAPQIGTNDKKEESASDDSYMKSSANFGFTYGILELKRGKLIFTTKKGGVTEYEIGLIENPRATFGILGFSYNNQASEISFGVDNTKKWVKVILDAKQGIYPQAAELSEHELEEYIRTHFNLAQKAVALKYYRERTGADLKTAREVVSRIL